MANWGFGLFQHVGVVLFAACLLGDTNTSPVARWVALIWAFNFSFIVWMYFAGLRLNRDVSRHRKGYVQDVVTSLALLLLFSAVEGWAAYLGFYDFVTRKQGFEVIAKGT